MKNVLKGQDDVPHRNLPISHYHLNKEIYLKVLNRDGEPFHFYRDECIPMLAQFESKFSR